MSVTKKAIKKALGPTVYPPPPPTAPKPDGMVTVKPTEWVGSMTIDLRLFAILLGMMVLAFVVGAVFG